MWYYIMKINEEEENENKALQEINVTSYGLLLPSLFPMDQQRYALVDSHWKTLCGEGNLVQPHAYIQVEYAQ